MGNKSTKADTTPGGTGRTRCNGLELADDTDPNKLPSDVPFDRYCFPFENIVFEGGGSKALAYCGAVRVLEDVGIWKQVVRLAGTSSGAMVAALLSVGYTSHDLHSFLVNKKLSKMFLEQSCGCCNVASTLRRQFGWSSGSKLSSWLGGKLKQATGDADITFLDVYKRFNKELCVVVTNVNQMMVEYCHPKTTPDMPVRLAVRMSMAIPGFNQPVKYKRFHNTDYYADGGVLCNFPVHSFDGWFLSMKPEDSFLRRVHPIRGNPRFFQKSERFGNHNEHTLGFMLFSENEPEFMHSLLEHRDGCQLPDKMPDTKLAKARLARLESRRDVIEEYDKLVEVLERLVKVLKEHELDTSHSINKEDFQHAISQSQNFTNDDFKKIFGAHTTVDDIFNHARKRSGQSNKFSEEKLQISYSDLISYLENKDVCLQPQYMGCRRQEVNNLTEFAQSLQDAVLFNTKKLYVEKRDVERTVGINTYYIGAMDFDMEKPDQQFLISQGERATRAFLLYHLMNMVPPLKGDWRKSFSRDDIKIFVDDELTEIIDTRDYEDTFNIRYDQ